MTPLAPDLVTAGAGTGKTYNIVMAVVDAVAAKTPLSRIAAITFTNRAAAELQRRLKSKLAERGFHREAAEVDAASISTIHAFCHRLTVENPLESRADGIDVPGGDGVDRHGTSAGRGIRSYGRGRDRSTRRAVAGRFW